MYKYLANTVFAGKNIIYLPTCHSTNDIAKDFVKKNTGCEGTIVITDDQTAGKGQRGNKWLSAPGENLTFSVIFKPGFLNGEEAFWLNKITSLAICNALLAYGVESKIKWPNDVYVKNKKIAGILIENNIERKRISYSILGIGLNVNQQKFPIESATSMNVVTNRIYEPNDVLESIVVNLEQQYLTLKGGKFDFIKANYLKRLLGLQESQMYEINGQKVEGIIEGVDNSGRLKVEIAGNIEYFSFKEIKFLI